VTESADGEKRLAEVEVEDVVVADNTSEKDGAARETLPDWLREPGLEIDIESVAVRPRRYDRDVA
jgi:hypothetical protein